MNVINLRLFQAWIYGGNQCHSIKWNIQRYKYWLWSIEIICSFTENSFGKVLWWQSITTNLPEREIESKKKENAYRNVSQFVFVDTTTTYLMKLFASTVDGTTLCFDLCEIKCCNQCLWINKNGIPISWNPSNYQETTQNFKYTTQIDKRKNQFNFSIFGNKNEANHIRSSIVYTI